MVSRAATPEVLRAEPTPDAVDDGAPEPGIVPTVTAIIVHHGDWALLERCLRALSVSRGVALDVVVVANACTDGPPAGMDREPGVHLVESTRPLGFSEANNLGVRWAEAHLPEPEAYLFLNNDTAVEPSAVALLVAALRRDPSLGIVGPCLRILGAEQHLNSLGLNVSVIGESWDEGIGRSLDDYGPVPEAREVLAVTGSALLARPSTLRQIGGWTEFYGFYMEDVDLCLKARSRGWSVVNETKATVYHQLSATAGQVTDFKKLLSWRNQMLLLAANWPLPTLLRVLPRFLARELAIYLRRRAIGAHHDARLQARAWRGALKLLPRALWDRNRRGDRRDWTRWLAPAGSVPEIHLPRQAEGSVRSPGTAGEAATRGRHETGDVPAPETVLE